MAEDRLTLLYFADASRRTGVEREEMALPDPPRVEALRRQVFLRHPRLEELQGSLLWSVDEEMADPATPLRAGQTVAVMPPFSGG